MTKCIIPALVVVFVSCSSAQDEPSNKGIAQGPTSGALCEKLESVRPGEQLPVRLSGVYEVGPEMAMFYDPQVLECNLDVQPATWIELASSVKTRSSENLGKLQRILEKSTRARVAFEGVLYGPGRPGPDDPSIPKMISYANRTSKLRYGHLNSFRTKLVVYSILRVEAVPSDSPIGALWYKKKESYTAPLVLTNPALPRYPQMPQRAGIEGKVVVEVHVESGEVKSVSVKSGDRMLTQETAESIRAWRFRPEVTTRFTTTFIYSLELRQHGSSSAPRIVLELPQRVTVIGATNGW